MLRTRSATRGTGADGTSTTCRACSEGLRAVGGPVRSGLRSWSWCLGLGGHFGSRSLRLACVGLLALRMFELSTEHTFWRTHVLNPPRPAGYTASTAASRGLSKQRAGSGARGPRPRGSTHSAGLSSSSGRGRASGSLQARFRVRMPCARTTSSAERLAATVLRQLHLEARAPWRRSSRAGRGAPVPLERAPKLGVARIELVADGVHHVLGVALDQGHRRRQLRPPAGAAAPARAAWRARRWSPSGPARAGLVRASLPRSSPGFTSTAAFSKSSSAIPPMCSRSQGTAEK